MLPESKISFSVFGAFVKFGESQLKSSIPATRKTKNNLKCSSSHLISTEVYLKCRKPSDGSVVLALEYGFKSGINRHLLTAGSF